MRIELNIPNDVSKWLNHYKKQRILNSINNSDIDMEEYIINILRDEILVMRATEENWKKYTENLQDYKEKRKKRDRPIEV